MLAAELVNERAQRAPTLRQFERVRDTFGRRRWRRPFIPQVPYLVHRPLQVLLVDERLWPGRGADLRAVWDRKKAVDRYCFPRPSQRPRAMKRDRQLQLMLKIITIAATR